MFRSFYSSNFVRTATPIDPPAASSNQTVKNICKPTQQARKSDFSSPGAAILLAVPLRPNLANDWTQLKASIVVNLIWLRLVLIRICYIPHLIFRRPSFMHFSAIPSRRTYKCFASAHELSWQLVEWHDRQDYFSFFASTLVGILHSWVWVFECVCLCLLRKMQVSVYPP